MKNQIFAAGVVIAALLGGQAQAQSILTSPDQQGLKLFLKDSFKKVNTQRWQGQNHTFGCNETNFNPANVQSIDGRSGMALKIDATPFGERQMSGAEIKFNEGSTGPKDEKTLHYGRFSAKIKTQKAPGTVASFFLYRWAPWQEIDFEFIGNDTRKVQINVFYSDDKVKVENPYGEPVQIQLPFDTSEDFHEYTIEWKEGVIIWYVDGNEIHRRESLDRTPNVPMTLRMNHWVACENASDWAGRFDRQSIENGKSISAEYKGIQIWQEKK